MLLLVACNKYSPRPMEYFRIEFEDKEYSTTIADHKPYQFDYPSNVARIVPHRDNPMWIDIFYPKHNARIHCSYMPINGNFYEISEDARAFVYKHSVKADAITQQAFENEEEGVYGILYELKGNVASSIQFTLTDSAKHYFRGALYFNNKPNVDSIAPVIQYIKQDIIHIMETMQWKK